MLHSYRAKLDALASRRRHSSRLSAPHDHRPIPIRTRSTSPKRETPPSECPSPTSAPPTPQLQSPFFRLPAELRLTIYTHYLTYHPGAFTPPPTPHPPTPQTFESPSLPRPPPPLLLTCRRALHDALPLARARATVHLSWRALALRVAVASHGPGPLAWPRVAALHLVVALAAPRFTAWAAFVRALLRAAGGLREVVVHWHPRGGADGADGAEGGEAMERVAREVAAIREMRAREFLDMLRGVEGLRRVTFLGDVPEWWVGVLEGGEEMKGKRGIQVTREGACANRKAGGELELCMEGGCGVIEQPLKGV